MIKVKDLKYSYPGVAADTIKDISFNISEGEIFGFLGPSGAGKSTVQKILIKILAGYCGNVTVNEKELSLWKNNYYEKIGVAFEFPNLFSKFTALENLNFFAGLYSGKCADPIELLEILGLEKDAKTLVSSFSKGMKMRLNFLRSIMHDPDILFLDEPTSGLDPANSRRMKDVILQKKAEGKTIFLTTHDMHAADELCDRVAFIVDGQIVLTDSPSKLKMKSGERFAKVEYRTEDKLESINIAVDQLGKDEKFKELLNSSSIETIHTLEATLEDVFIETTGRRLV